MEKQEINKTEEIKKQLIAIKKARKNGAKYYTVAELDEALRKILDL